MYRRSYITCLSFFIKDNQKKRLLRKADDVTIGVNKNDSFMTRVLCKCGQRGRYISETNENDTMAKNDEKKGSATHICLKLKNESST
jgi:hypothetical protein